MGTDGDGSRKPAGRRASGRRRRRRVWNDAGKRLLIARGRVFVIALDLQHLLEAARHEVAGLAANVADALALAGSASWTGPSSTSTCAASAWARWPTSWPAARSRRVRLGYGSSGRPPGHDHVPVLAKPYNEAELLGSWRASERRRRALTRRAFPPAAEPRPGRRL
jgi:hypothetical protein